ncbi:hypothetical protein NDU88_005288 [Pleurodeles waltl]|uniref:Uncharacterized protein n=1 Tax=Pleurodeles waltl TaxID=8319 RepID=A0AAV7MVY7_PLEWA|nr:hypothetical protein NDU88_005288 [Pleurodeles waltl]
MPLPRRSTFKRYPFQLRVLQPVVDSQLSLFIVALNFLPLVSLVAPGTLLCSVLLLYGSPVLQCARGSPRFYLLGNPPLARPRGRDPPSASLISRPFFLACLILSSGFLSPGYSFNLHGSRAAFVRGHPDPAPGSVEPATLHLAQRCLQGSTRSRYPSFSPLLRCVPGPKGPPQVKRPRSLTPGHVATSKSFHTASLSLLASLRPQSFLGASPVAQSSTTSPPVRVRLPLGHQNPNGISTPARSLRRQPPLSSASTCSPARGRGPDPGPAPCVLLGSPVSSVLVSVRLHSARSHLGPPGPRQHLRRRQRARLVPPAVLCRPRTHHLDSRHHARPRPLPRAQTHGLRSPRRADSAPPGSPQGPTHARPSPLVHARPPGRLNLRPRPRPRPRSRSCPLCYSGAARIQWHSLRALQVCAISPGPPGPRQHLRRRRRACSAPPAVLCRPRTHHFCSRHHARPRPLPRAQTRRLRSPRRADSAPPWSPQGPTHARPPPLVSPCSLDLIRPREGTILTFYSPAPPELRVQACAISGSLATPPSPGVVERWWSNTLHDVDRKCFRDKSKITILLQHTVYQM